jgi:predicted secreted hydrolase
VNIKSLFLFLFLFLFLGYWLVIDGKVYADDYELLRSSPEGYSKVVSGRALQFPEDHLPHEDYRIEWWYLTANLESDTGEQYGIHWTLFRQSMNPNKNPGGWSSNQVWMAHAALSKPDSHVYEERFARGGIGQAGVNLEPSGDFSAWMDNWSLKGTSASPLPGVLAFTVQDIGISLDLDARTPWVLQGNNGYSQKSEQGQASYYYSQPHIDVVGTLSEQGQDVRLTGKAWLDREWSSQPLAPDQPGWDWLSIHLDDGYALMIYRLRQSSGKDWYSGTWVSPEGVSESLMPDDLVFEPLATTEIKTGENKHRGLPLAWRVVLPKQNRQWSIQASSSDHWLNTAFPYWEGPVVVTDVSSGAMVGKGYLELTGY